MSSSFPLILRSTNAKQPLPLDRQLRGSEQSTPFRPLHSHFGSRNNPVYTVDHCLYVPVKRDIMLKKILIMPADIGLLPSPEVVECNVIKDSLCNIALRDTYTLVLNFWIGLQLVWVTMLCAVQLVQISRNQTTYENMRGHSIDHARPSSQAITSAIAAGTTSLDAAGLSASGHGPNPSLSAGAPHRHRQGCFQQWKMLLGLDSFLATAQGGFRERRGNTAPRNPFSRGLITNCRDFWCDSEPYFGKRESGVAMLAGEKVNYNEMYEVPLRMRRGGGDRSQGAYASLAAEDPENAV